MNYQLVCAYDAIDVLRFFTEGSVATAWHIFSTFSNVISPLTFCKAILTVLITLMDSTISLASTSKLMSNFQLDKMSDLQLDKLNVRSLASMMSDH